MNSRTQTVLFYILSFTWGLPMTLIGAVLTGALFLCGHRVRRFGACRYIETGTHWGGVSFGIFFLANSTPSAHICLHEAGHAVQNILFGPLMPLLVALPSALRYWYRRLSGRCTAPYERIWFEAQATALGNRYFSRFAAEEITRKK